MTGWLRRAAGRLQWNTAVLAVLWLMVGASTAAAQQGGQPPAQDPGDAVIECKVGCFEPTYDLEITPDGTAISVDAPATGRTAVFTVTSTGTDGKLFTFSCSHSGGVTCTGLSLTSIFLDSGEQVQITATYNVGTTSGYLFLNSNYDTGRYQITAVTHGVTVTPDNGQAAAIRPAGFGPFAEQFTVKNTGSGPEFFSFTCIPQAPVSCGTVSQPNQTLQSQQELVVWVNYFAGATEGNGRVTLRAMGSSGVQDEGYYNVRVDRYDVAVTPDDKPVSLPVNYTAVDTFVVKNTGSVALTYGFECRVSGSVVCLDTPGAVFLQPGAEARVPMSFRTGSSAATNNFVYLRAIGPNDAIDDGSLRVSQSEPPPTVTLEVPRPTGTGRAVVANRQPIIRARFVPPPGRTIDTTRTVFRWRGATLTSTARHNRGLLEWEVDSARALGIGDSARVEVTACTTLNKCTTASQWVVLPNDQRPVLGFQGMPQGVLGPSFSGSFGPGLSVSGAELETGFATVPYYSMGVARSFGLVYSTRQSYPRALVPVNLELPWTGVTSGSGTVKLVLLDGTTRMDSLSFGTAQCLTGVSRRACRAVLQADYASSTTAYHRKWLKVEATVTADGTNRTSVDSVETIIVDRRASHYGSGWWPSVAAKLVSIGSDRVLISPTGTATIYRGWVNGADTVYLPPPGVQTSLTRVGGVWRLQPRGSLGYTEFDQIGRLAVAVDQNGNRDSVLYEAWLDKVVGLRDPVGRRITVSYTNDRISAISDPGERVHRVVIDAATNQLVLDSLDAPGSTAKAWYVYRTYPGTMTTALTQRIGRGDDTTTVVYDSTFRRRPVQALLPAVADVDGVRRHPVLKYVALERRGFGMPVSLDSTYLEMRDPRNHWTRSLVNRWGQATRTWDSLGLRQVATYDPNGLLLMTEGKTGSASRTTYTYDADQHLVRTTHARTATESIRVDSLVYDANHRIERRIDPRGNVTKYLYDARWNVTHTITPRDSFPEADTTVVYYAADGLVDSTRLPGDTRVSKYVYTPDSLRLLYQEIDRSGDIRATNRYDVLGRLIRSKRKIRAGGLVLDGGPWRTHETFYGANNQVDSMRTSRWGGEPALDAPWSPHPDSAHVIRYIYDRAGRDSLRIGNTGVAEAWQYDALGRMIRHWPYADSVGVRDSLVYDLAGNTVKRFTRRGDVITVTHDSRNRVVTSDIPTVGVLNKAYGGPLDQLTRMWYSNAVDSIGGVNGAVSWVYDSTGYLISDTTFTGPIARGTSYTYDTWGRLETRTDALGTWRTVYDPVRHHVSKVITPYAIGDTLHYLHDPQGRLTTQYVRTAVQSCYLATGGIMISRNIRYTTAGGLKDLSTTVAGDPWISTCQPGTADAGYRAGRHGQPELTEFEQEDAQQWVAPQWEVTRGKAATAKLYEEGVEYDAWARLRSWTLTQGATTVATESYDFDRAGNVSQPTGPGVYNLVTDRLVSRNEGGITRTFQYDRSGNQTQEIGASIWDYQFDALDRLVAVRRNGTLIARYGYDVLGRRIVKKVYSTESGASLKYQRYVYHGDQVAYETDAPGNIGLRYVWGPGVDNLVTIQDASLTKYWTVTDKLGSVRGLVKKDRTWAGGANYRPYGGTVGSDVLPAWMRYRWTGREYDDETGLYFMRARYFNPTIRRFISEDPIGRAGGENLYAYVSGQVLEARDPTGLRGEGGYWGGFSCDMDCYNTRQYTAEEFMSPWMAYQVAQFDAANTYQDYLFNYENNRLEFTGRPDVNGLMFEGSPEPLSRDDYRKAMGGLLFAERSGLLNGSTDLLTVQMTIDRLEGGQYFYNDAIFLEFERRMPPGQRAVALTPAGGLFTVVARQLFAKNTAACVAASFVHETFHAQGHTHTNPYARDWMSVRSERVTGCTGMVGW